MPLSLKREIFQLDSLLFHYHGDIEFSASNNKKLADSNIYIKYTAIANLLGSKEVEIFEQ